MEENKIRMRLWEKGIKQADVIRELPDVNAVQFSAIVAGNVMPTRGDLAVICEKLDCKPTDLYSPEALRLGGDEKVAQAAPVVRLRREDGREKKEGQERFRVWMEAKEKAALIDACKVLGYKSTAEWFREMYRETLTRCATIASGLPQQIEFAAAAGAEHYTIADIPHRLLSSSLNKS